MDFSLQQFCFWPSDRRKITFYWGNRAAAKKEGHFPPFSAVSQATDVIMPSKLVQQSPAIVERPILVSNNFAFDLVADEKSLFTGNSAGFLPEGGWAFRALWMYEKG